MAPEVFYVHGMGGSPADWREVQKQVPGHALALPAAAHDPEACAAELSQEILQRAGGRPFALCGYSLGGRIALLAASHLLRQGNPPSHLVLLAAGMGEVDARARAERFVTDDAWASLAARDAGEFWQRWYEQPLFASFRSLPEAARAVWLAERKSIDIGRLVSQLRKLGPGRHGDLLPVLECLARKGISVLYIAGEQDKKYVELAQKVQEIGGVAVRTIPRAGHILPLEAPAELASSLSAFLSSQENPNRGADYG